MSGGQVRILRRRIRSIQATKKITRAMELIAASRIVKAQQRVVAAVPYSDSIAEVVRDLAAAGGEVQSPLLQGRPDRRKLAIVAIAADRGLCGSYNTAVFRAAEGELKARLSAGLEYTLLGVGRKAETYFRFRGYEVLETHTGFSEQPGYGDARRIGRSLVQHYLAGDIDSVEIIYTRFISSGRQEVVIRPLIPLDAEIVEGGDARPDTHSEDGPGSEYTFEPSPSEILDSLLPRYIEARLYAALLNAAASEQAFRQRAMKSATDNAEDLMKSLTRLMNRARQEAITTEIMEVVGGAEALSGEDDDEMAEIEGRLTHHYFESHRDHHYFEPHRDHHVSGQHH